jgi:hypothetical protein
MAAAVRRGCRCIARHASCRSSTSQPQRDQLRTVVLQPAGEIELDQGDLQSWYCEARRAQQVVDMNRLGTKRRHDAGAVAVRDIIGRWRRLRRR